MHELRHRCLSVFRIQKNIRNQMAWHDWLDCDRLVFCLAVYLGVSSNNNSLIQGESEFSYRSRILLKSMFEIRGRDVPACVEACLVNARPEDVVRLLRPASRLLAETHRIPIKIRMSKKFISKK